MGSVRDDGFQGGLFYYEVLRIMIEEFSGPALCGEGLGTLRTLHRRLESVWTKGASRGETRHGLPSGVVL